MYGKARMACPAATTHRGSYRHPKTKTLHVSIAAAFVTTLAHLENQ